jgi:hypothetical protein
MGYNPNGPQGPNGPHNQNVPQMQGMNHAMSNKSFQSGMYYNLFLLRSCDLVQELYVLFCYNISLLTDFGQQNSANSNNPPESNDKNSGDRNELPPLPPGPPPPISGHSYSTPVPHGTSPLRPQFYGQTNNSKCLKVS